MMVNALDVEVHCGRVSVVGVKSVQGEAAIRTTGPVPFPTSPLLNFGILRSMLLNHIFSSMLHIQVLFRNWVRHG